MRTYRAVRRLRIGNGWREPGELVPEAATWRIVESVVRAGEMEEVDVTGQEFSAAVQQYCPDEADQIYAVLGLQPFDPGPTAYEPSRAGEGGAGVTQEPREEVDPEPPPRPRRSRKKAPILVEPPQPVEE